MSNISAGVQRMLEAVCKLKPRFAQSRVGHLVFGHHGEGGAPDRVARILIRRRLDPSGHHQPKMHTVMHVVGGQQSAQFGNQGLALEADIQADALCAPQYRRSKC
jgi:hypothetical protein